ncbi:DUF6125 family protein [Chloroflexota bacterium]
MRLVRLEDLPRETLIELARMYARNWQTLDGLWFGSVEREYGLEAAVKLDIRNWEKQSSIEAQRIKKVLGLNEGGLPSILQALSFMSWQMVSPLFEVEEESPRRIVFFYPRCTVQEGRKKGNKPEFPCKTMKTTLLANLTRIIEPRASVKCLACPPDPHPDDCWCRWELTMDDS